MRDKSFKAFTILELLVGMILSGIVLTATFTAYRITTRQYESYGKKSVTMTELSFFVSQLESDFEKAKTITRNSENEIMLQSENSKLEYRFPGNYVLRNNFYHIDTFHVAVSAVETFLQKEKINSDESVIDELHLFLDVEGKKEEKIYRKEISSKAELDQQEAALH
jgi:competence protein ComGF